MILILILKRGVFWSYMWKIWYGFFNGWLWFFNIWRDIRSVIYFLIVGKVWEVVSMICVVFIFYYYIDDLVDGGRNIVECYIFVNFVIVLCDVVNNKGFVVNVYFYRK